MEEHKGKEKEKENGEKGKKERDKEKKGREKDGEKKVGCHAPVPNPARRPNRIRGHEPVLPYIHFRIL